MLQFRIKIFITLLFIYLAVGLVSFAVFKFVAPQYYFNFYPIIGVFYWICGIVLNFFLDRCHLANPDKLLNTFMMVRLAKFLLTIGFLFVGIKVMKIPTAPFVISLMCNYFIYIAIEMYIYSIYNKRITSKNESKENSK